MLGSFESARWNARVHRLGVGLYSHSKDFFFFFFFFFGGGWVGGVKETPSLPEAQRKIEPATLHHAGQPALHTTDWAIPALANDIQRNHLRYCSFPRMARQVKNSLPFCFRLSFCCCLPIHRGNLSLQHCYQQQFSVWVISSKRWC